MKNESWIDSLCGETIASTPPKGFFTVQQIAAMKGLSRNHVNDLLSKEIAAGRIKLVKVKIKSGQRTYPVPHYGPA